VCINIEGTWTELENCYVRPNSGTDISLWDSTVTPQYHGPARLAGLVESHGQTKPLYLLEDTFPRKPFIEFTFNEDLATSDASAEANITSEWGPGFARGVGETVTVLNHETHTAGTYEFYADEDDTGFAIHVGGDEYKIIYPECP